jgi:hypothetical protein
VRPKKDAEGRERLREKEILHQRESIGESYIYINIATSHGRISYLSISCLFSPFLFLGQEFLKDPSFVTAPATLSLWGM